MSLRESRTFRLMVEIMGYSSAAVFGPLAVFLGLGLWLDRTWGTHPKMLLFGLAVSFILTNVLLIKKGGKMSRDSFRVMREINNKEKNKNN